MTMTKKKKRITVLISLLAVLLLAAVLFTNWFFKPHVYYRPEHTIPVDSAEFPTPDSVVYIKAFRHELNEEDQRTLIAAYTELLQNLDSVDSYLGFYTLREVRANQLEFSALEYRYNSRQRYTGVLKNTHEWSYGHFGNLVFDTIQMFPSGELSSWFVCTTDGEYRHDCMALNFNPTAMEAYRQTVREVLSHYNFEKPGWLTE